MMGFVEQQVINWIFGLVCALGGYLFSLVLSSIKDVKSRQDKLSERMGAIEVLVAGAYLRRDEYERNISQLREEFNHTMTAILTKLEKISDVQMSMMGRRRNDP